MTDTKVIKKIITKEKFEKALSNGNYKEVFPDAKKIIDASEPFDLLELDTQFGSALKVLSARKLDEARFAQLLRGC